MESSGGLFCCGFWFHPELAYCHEDDEHSSAEGEDLTDADVAAEESGEDEAGDLGGEDDGHEGGTDAAHQLRRSCLLEEGLGRDDDAGDREADDEVAEDGRPEVWEGGEDDETDGDAAEAGVDEDGVPQLFAEGVEAVDADQHAEADHGGGDGEGFGGGVKRVAHVDGDERAEAAEDEHACCHGEDDEEESGVVNDEVDALLHVEPHFADGRCVGGLGCWRGWLGCGCHEGDGGDQESGADEAGGVKGIAADGSEVGDHEASEGGADDAHAEHDLLHECICGAEAVQWNGGADGDSLGRAEEAGDDADGGEDRVEVPDLRGEDEQEAEAGTDGVA